jgi:hypothetical protein
MAFKGDVCLRDAIAAQASNDGTASVSLGSSGNEIAPQASGVLLLAGARTLDEARKGEKSDASWSDVGWFFNPWRLFLHSMYATSKPIDK